MKIQKFIDEHTIHSKRPETVRVYREELERFRRFLKVECLRIDQVTPSMIGDFVRDDTHRRTGSRPLSTATINRRLSVLAQYFMWAQGDQIRARRRSK